MILVASFYFFALFCNSGCNATPLSKVMDTFKIGLRLASTFLDSDQNQVFWSILERFGGSRSHEGKKNGPESVIPFFLKFMGLNATKLEDLAFDGFVFLTHLISETLTDAADGMNRKQRSSASESFGVNFSPFQYLIKHPKVLGLLTQMEDSNTIEFILNESKRKLKGYPAEDVQCIPLLVCKMYPFVKGMQRSLKFFMNKNSNFTDSCFQNATDQTLNLSDCQERILWENSNPQDRMFFFLPSLDEVLKHGDKCDDRFPKCVY